MVPVHIQDLIKGNQVPRPKIAFVVKRSCTSEVNPKQQGSSAHLMPLEALRFLMLKYAFPYILETCQGVNRVVPDLMVFLSCHPVQSNSQRTPRAFPCVNPSIFSQFWEILPIGYFYSKFSQKTTLSQNLLVDPCLVQVTDHWISIQLTIQSLCLFPTVV